VDKPEVTAAISGKIEARPNPICFGQRCVVISWDTNDPAGVEVRVSTGSGNEKLVTQGGKSGHVEIPWITDSTVYEFRLYAASRLDVPLDSVKARRDIEAAPAALREIADEATRGNIDVMELSQFIGTVLPRCIRSERFREIFSFWEQRGFHVTPVHCYQPIPDTSSLPKMLWNRPSKLVGINMNESMQLDLLRTHFPKFRGEYEQFPTRPTANPAQFYLNNGPFDRMDALVAYCMVRHFRPRLIVEIGGGFSSLLLGQALQKNGNASNLVCIEPSPLEFLKRGFPGLHSLIEKTVQTVDLDFFSQLGPDDMLFIDSSHTVKIGGDVNYLFLEVLPRLKAGVIVHIHDIFLPFDYPRDWVMNKLRFWTEQYLLQTFLTFNTDFEVLMSNSYLNHYHKHEIKATFPSLPWPAGGSFWMRRKPTVD
jgi:hypothetical protein